MVMVKSFYSSFLMEPIGTAGKHLVEWSEGESMA
jgi:hypothetical protein